MHDDESAQIKLSYNPDRTGILQIKDPAGKQIAQTNLKGRRPWTDTMLALSCMEVIMNEYTSGEFEKDNIKTRISQLKDEMDPTENVNGEEEHDKEED